MVDRTDIEALGEHRYLVRVSEGEDTVEILMLANPSAVARLGSEEVDELRVVQSTADYLIARQRADDLPAELDLDDVAAAYDGFEEHLRRQLATVGGRPGGSLVAPDPGAVPGLSGPLPDRARGPRPP